MVQPEKVFVLSKVFGFAIFPPKFFLPFKRIVYLPHKNVCFILKYYKCQEMSTCFLSVLVSSWVLNSRFCVYRNRLIFHLDSHIDSTALSAVSGKTFNLTEMSPNIIVSYEKCLKRIWQERNRIKNMMLLYQYMPYSRSLYERKMILRQLDGGLVNIVALELLHV